MANIATVLKSEISRLARKETRGKVGSLRRAVTTYRSEIAALKRRILELEKQLNRLSKGARAASTRAPVEDGPHAKVRFSAKGLAAQRKRLGLSAHDVGLLVGATGQSIYNWEAGKARPRASHMRAIVALRTLGKRQAEAVLSERR